MKPLPNENYVNSFKLKKELPIVFKNLSKFIDSKKAHPNIYPDLENMIRGECATLIRRHIPFLTKTTISFSVKNIDTIYFDRITNKILYFRFIKHYAGCSDDFIIDELNKHLQEIIPMLSIYKFTSKLDSITNNIKHLNQNN